MKRIIRLLWYWIRLLAAIAAALACIAWAFFGMMDAANIWVLCSEALDLRNHVILQEEAIERMDEVFTDSFISTDIILTDNPYRDFVVDNFDARYNVSRVSCWPWRSRATATVTMRIPIISASLRKDAVTDAKTPPPWPSAKYNVHLLRTESGWKIDRLEALEAVPDRWVPPWITSPPPTPEPTPTLPLIPQPTTTP
ncbi:MAG: hypothetical protein FWD16_00750 [Clostridia bacterium]|nr:hypothetical protein [Clostridia bacterium]